MDIFKSKIDKWLIICLAVSIIACLLGASVMLKIGGTVNYALAAVILVAGAGFPLWLFISTRYIVKHGNLEIFSGPFSWIIPVKSIESVQETQSAVTSPALSFDRLEIKYDDGKAIIISPADKAAFMERLDNEKLTILGKSARQQTAEKTSRSKTQKTRKNKNRQI